jgi:hypothetical protein
MDKKQTKQWEIGFLDESSTYISIHINTVPCCLQTVEYVYVSHAGVEFK